MKTWEKIQQLDQQYVEARKQLLLGQAESVTLTVKPKAVEKKNATKSRTKESSQ